MVAYSNSMEMTSSTSSGIPIVCIAPMIQWTDRHYRFLMRLMTRETQLYTPMFMDTPLLYNKDRLHNFIGHNAVEHPLALQLGGSEPEKLGEAAALCESFGGFCEINLNAGCPSGKAKKFKFGAKLMRDPEQVQQILYEMKRRAPSTRISIKSRIGVCGRDSYDQLVEFVHAVCSSGVRHMIIHGRKCVVSGLSPAQNRTIPPLRYDIVHRIVKEFPDMNIVLNGGITDFDQAEEHLNTNYESPDGDLLPPVHGIMIGRAAYNNPWMFQDADRRFFGRSNPAINRLYVVEKYIDYAIEALDDTYMHCTFTEVLKPMHNFFTGLEGARCYKQKLSDLCEQRKCLFKDNSLDDLLWEAIENTISRADLEEEVRIDK